MNTAAVSQRLFGSRDRRTQVGHDDGAGELARGIGQHGTHQCVVAQMQMPVVGAGEFEFHVLHFNRNSILFFDFQRTLVQLVTSHAANLCR